MEKTILCTPENIREFNRALRQELPEAIPLVKALVELGLMEGLRGARIGPPGAFERGVRPITSDAAEKRLADASWARHQADAQGRAGR